MKTSKFRERTQIPKTEIPKEEQVKIEDPKKNLNFPVIREKHPYLRIVVGDIKSVLGFIGIRREQSRVVAEQTYDPLTAAHMNGKRGF